MIDDQRDLLVKQNVMVSFCVKLKNIAVNSMKALVVGNEDGCLGQLLIY